MTFSELSIYLEKLEDTASRNSMIELLADLFKKVKASEIDKMVYLLQGRVVPLYVALEFGMADKMVLRSIAQAYGVSEKETNDEFKKIGDTGLVAQKFNHKKSSETTISEVFQVLKEAAETNGAGSVEKKITLLSNLFKNLDSLSVRFVARIPVGRLRLGFSDMTVLDSLSWMLSGTKSERADIEPVFNIHPDLGFIAKIIKEDGVAGLQKATPSVFTPVLMARAERLSSGEEIIAKIGECAIEPKFDGFRLQAHFKNGEVKLFTRNLEDATAMYPDVALGIKTQIKAKSAILEGEAIAYNPETGEFLPFQETSQRKRKYDIEEMAKKIPLKFMAFELLYVDGENLINSPYVERRKRLSSIIGQGETIYLSEEKVLGEGDEVEHFFDDAISRGLEGILAKKLDGKYQAGARSWNWIKFKRSYSAHLDDTIDCLVLGYYSGRGKRTAFGIGAFLIGIYDKKSDKYVSIAKIGTGLTDDEWRELYRRGEKLKASVKPPLYEVDKLLDPDEWIEPEIVVEIKADEITRSTIHTAGRALKPSKSGAAFDVDIPGYALRFPRLEKFRDDRKPEDVTELSEIEEMFESQINQQAKKNE